SPSEPSCGAACSVGVAVAVGVDAGVDDVVEVVPGPGVGLAEHPASAASIAITATPSLRRTMPPVDRLVGLHLRGRFGFQLSARHPVRKMSKLRILAPKRTYGEVNEIAPTDGRERKCARPRS